VTRDLFELPKALQSRFYLRLAVGSVLISVQGSRNGRYVAGHPALVIGQHPKPLIDLALVRREAEEEVAI
jgi:hypothetical protein